MRTVSGAAWHLTGALAGLQSNILDFVVWVATFLGVTFAGVEIGIAIGVGLSFLYVGLKVGQLSVHILFTFQT